MPSKDPIQRFEDILKQRHPHPGVHEGDGLELLAEELCPDVPWADVRALATSCGTSTTESIRLASG